MIYFDYAATEAYKAGFNILTLGNANSPHQLGISAREKIEDCRNQIKKILGVASGKVVFGGTTSMLVERIVYRIGRFDYCSPVDHDCFYWNSITRNGFGDLSNVHANNTYCHIHTNNVTGDIYDLEEIGHKIKRNGGYFLIDTTATWGHAIVPNNIEDWCDAVFCSAHKIGGPEGTGFMWLSDDFSNYLKLPNDSIDEFEMWPGTPAVNNIVEMTKCFEYVNSNRYIQTCYKNAKDNSANLKYWLNEYGIKYEFIKEQNSSDFINAIWLDGINADALVRYASDREVYISPAHSACAQEGDYRVLLNSNFKVNKKKASETIRVSFGSANNYLAITKLAKIIKDFKEQYC